ncbi:acetate uptake transporter [Archaeoglobus sp.]
MEDEKWANPSIVGLMGFALTTMATGLHVAGFWKAIPTLALALAFGGTAQFVAGIIDLRRNSIFGGTAFTSYGAFWWAVFIKDVILPAFGFTASPMDNVGFAFVWFLFTFALLIASTRLGKLLTLLFLLLWIAFGLLMALPLGLVPASLTGWEIFITGLLAWYMAMAELVNTVFERKVLPFA